MKRAGAFFLVLFGLLPAAASGADWSALDRALEEMARFVELPVDRLRVDPAALALEDSFTGRLRLEQYFMAEPRRAPAAVDALAAGMLSSRGAAPRLELLARLGWTRPFMPRPLEIDPVRLPTDTLRNPVESAMERLYAGTGKRFQGKDRSRLVNESGRLPALMQRRLAALLDAIMRADRLREAVARSSELKQGGAFGGKSKKTAALLRQYLLRWGEPGLEADETMSRLVYALGTVNLDVLYRGAIDLARVVDESADSLGAGVSAVPPLHHEWDSPVGRIAVGGSGDDVYSGSYALVVDAGGNDVYRGAGGTSGREGVSVVIDLAGDDRYLAADSLLAGPGGAILGYAGIVDLDGNDEYTATAWGGGFGFLGVGWIHDRAGDDVYRMQWQSLGCGLFGLGLLLDESGRDEYVMEVHAVEFPYGQGQGFGGPFGLGVLQDGAGDDQYRATASDSSSAWFAGAPFGAGSLVQGASLGVGTRWAGGLGLLADGGGNDRYAALRFAQGAACGAGLGILADRVGNDDYAAEGYAMGSGLGLGAGVLIEGAGDDVYTAGKGALGAGEDLGLGLLADGGGNDRYRVIGPGTLGGPSSLASAYRQGAGWVLDGGGEDEYPEGLLQANPGISEPWRAPVPGVSVLIDLDQASSWRPAGVEARVVEGSNPARLVLSLRGGPGVGGGLVTLRGSVPAAN